MKHETSGIKKNTNARWIETTTTMNKLRRDHRNLRRRINYLIDKYNKSKVEIKMEFKNGSAVYAYMDKMFKNLKKTKGKSRQ